MLDTLTPQEQQELLDRVRDIYSYLFCDFDPGPPDPISAYRTPIQPLVSAYRAIHGAFWRLIYRQI